MNYRCIFIFLLFVTNLFAAGKSHYVIQNSDLKFKMTGSGISVSSVLNNAEDSSWEKLHPMGLYQNFSDKDNFWLRVKLPDTKWKKPSFSLRTYLYGFEIYQNGRSVYRYGDQSDKKIDNYLNWLVVPLDTAGNPKYFIMRIPLKGMAYLGGINIKYIGEEGALYELSIKEINDLHKSYTKEIILSIILFFISFISVLIFFIRIKNRDYSFMYFALFAFLSGATYFDDTSLFLLNHIPPLVYTLIENISTFALPVGMLLFVGKIFGTGWKNIINKLWVFHLLLTVIVCILTFSRILIAYPFFLFVAGVFVDLVVMIRVIYKSRNNSAYKIKPVLYSFILFSLCGIHDLLTLLDLLPWTTILFGWGLLGLVFSFGYILVKHYMDTYHLVNQYSIELAEKKDELDKLQQENILSQFEALKSQINPHFLFNTFSTLIDLIEENPELAVDFVQQLSKVYRYVLLSKDNQSVELRCELEFLESYNFLLSKRYGNNLQIILGIEAIYYDRHIPPLTLQLLVENAIKHNIISSKKPLIIEILADTDDYLIVKNNLQKKTIVESSTKIGLQNIINRYKYMCDKKIEVISNHTSFFVRVPFLNKQVENESSYN